MRPLTQQDINNRPRFNHLLGYAINIKRGEIWQSQFNECSICHNHNFQNQCEACGWWGYVNPWGIKET